MTGPPERPEEPMHDEMADLWRRYRVLEEIAERLAATCADPIAVNDYWSWKEDG